MNQQDRDEPSRDAAVERLMRLAGARPSPDATARLRARETAREAWREAVAVRRRRRRLTWTMPALAAAAVLLIVVLPSRERELPPPAGMARLVTGTLVVEGRSGEAARQAGPGEILGVGQTLRTANGDTAALALMGGGELRLNGGTSVRLAGERRFALDQGQLYLDSGHAGGSTLLVDTIAGSVQDIGTRFEVTVQGREVRIRVREGAVRLVAGGRQTDAAAGQQVVASPGDQASVARTDIYGPNWSWLARASPFAIEGATLEAFLRWVEREGGRRVVFADPELRATLGATRLHGSVAGLTTEEALEAVLPATGLSHRVADDRIEIRREGTGR